MKTPIYIDFDLQTTYLSSNELDLNKIDPIDLYTSALLANPPFVNIQFILAPRYYILIKSPKDQNLATIKIPIHKSSFSQLKNKIRVLLNPSLSYGINSSYKVEYWEWIPNIGFPEQPANKKIKEEYWYVPTLDNNFVPQFPFPLHLNEYQYWANRENYNYPRLTTELITVTRTFDTVTNLVIDTLDLTKPYIFCFDNNNIVKFEEFIELEYFPFTEETQLWNFSKKLTSSVLTRKSTIVDGELIDGITQTNIEYVIPFNSSHLIVTD